MKFSHYDMPEFDDISEEWRDDISEEEFLEDTEIKMFDVKAKRLNPKDLEPFTPRYDKDDQYKIAAKYNAADRTREGLESQGLSYDILIETADMYDHLLSDEGLMIEDLKNDIARGAMEKGPDHMQEVADRMFENEEISEEAYETITRINRIALAAKG